MFKLNIKKLDYRLIVNLISLLITFSAICIGVGRYLQDIHYLQDEINLIKNSLSLNITKQNDKTADMKKQLFLQVNEITEIKQQILWIKEQHYFTQEHALRDFKFVKDDENILYKRLGSVSDFINTQQKSISTMAAQIAFLMRFLNESLYNLKRGDQS